MNILQQIMQMQSKMELHLQCALSRDAGQLDSRWATVAKGSREVGKSMLLLALLLLLLLLGLGIAADAVALSSNSSCSTFYESVSRSGAPRSKQANKHQPSLSSLLFPSSALPPTPSCLWKCPCCCPQPELHSIKIALHSKRGTYFNFAYFVNEYNRNE